MSDETGPPGGTGTRTREWDPSITSLEDRRLRGELLTRLFSHAPTQIRIGDFRIERKLGQGSMGVVYLAVHANGTRAAIKTLVTSSRVAHARLRREAEALQLLQHRNIVRILGAGEYDDGAFVAMEYVEGPTLRAWTTHEPRSVAALVGMFGAVADALRHTHEAGLLHRDFKPDNVLVDGTEVPKLLDFGLARAIAARPEGVDPILVETLTRSGVLIGTPAYAPPEQHLGRDVDARGDQFAFGVSLYEALCGRRPFAGRTADAVDLARLRGQIEPFDARVPDSLRRVVTRMLSAEPDDRFSSMSDVVAALREQEPR